MLPDRPAVRLWLARLVAAVALPVAFFLGVEGLLRWAGFGHSVHFLVPDEAPGDFRTNPAFASSFLPSEFDLRPLNFRIRKTKPPGTLRVVVLGESAAQGVPVPAFGFAAQLRAQWRARHPGQEIEVINTGVVAVNSHVIYQIARDLAPFAPDLLIVYAGNNEVVGPYGPGCAYLPQMPPLWFIRLSVFVRSTRTGQLVTRVLSRLAPRPRSTAEWGGMAMFANSAVRGDDPRLDAVYRNFESNLSDIVQVAAGTGAKVVLCTVASNLKDCAPLLSLHRPGLTAPDLARWNHLFMRGRTEWLGGDDAAARADLTAALQIDPQSADTLYLLGVIELRAGNVPLARGYLVSAEHWDALRFRPDPRVNDVVRKVAQAGGPGVSFVDAAKLLGSDPESTGVPAGREVLFEHVHLNWEGNYRLGRLLAEAAEKVLGRSDSSARPWLDAPGCAAALAYTAHEQSSVLTKLAGIVQHPPFTNQLTFCEDQAALARDLARAQAERTDPAQLRNAAEVARRAIAGDPQNADLALLAAEIDLDRGEVAAALSHLQRAQALQPSSRSLAANEAIMLSRLGRFTAAQQVLNHVTARSFPGDRTEIAPAFADWFLRTGRFAEGRQYFDHEVARHPAEFSLRLLRGQLGQAGGDLAAAEREFCTILERDPGNQPALEALEALLNRSGRTADAERQCLAFAAAQPGNAPNNLRAAIISDRRHDDAGEVRWLLAAERSGPVSAGVEFRLGRKFAALGRSEEAALHFAEARRLGP